MVASSRTTPLQLGIGNQSIEFCAKSGKAYGKGFCNVSEMMESVAPDTPKGVEFEEPAITVAELDVTTEQSQPSAVIWGMLHFFRPKA